MQQKITKELVFSLADQAVAQGFEPTNLKIRELNGTHGSLTSIGPHLKAWREQRAVEAVEAMPDMPEARLLEVLRPVWSELVRESSLLYKEKQESFELEIASAREETAGYMAEIDRQAVVIESVGEQLLEAQEQLRQKTIEIAELKERDVQQLQRITDLSADKHHAAQLREEMRVELATTHDENEKLHDQVARLTGDNRLLTSQNNDNAAKIESLDAKLNVTREQLTAAEDRRVDDNNRMATLKAKLEAKVEQVDSLKQHQEKLDNIINEHQAANIELTGSLKGSQAAAKQVGEELARATVRADELQTELLTLARYKSPDKK